MEFSRKLGCALIKESVCVVVKVRDEQDGIKDSLFSLLNQEPKPFIVVVNDGSVDRTGEIASRYADVVVHLPRHEESWVGRPELAMVINSGLDALETKRVDFVMFSDGEAIYPSDYIAKTIERMRKIGAVLASGIAVGEASGFSPRGCGRIVDASWFRKVGFKYPENYAFEAYLVYKALSEGRKVAVFPELKFNLLRRTQMFPRKAYSWGKGMKALNYNVFYALARAFMFSFKSPKNGFALLRGYFSDVEKYRDIEDFVPAFQRRRLPQSAREVLNVARSKYMMRVFA